MSSGSDVQPDEESIVAIREAEETITTGSEECYDNGQELIEAAMAESEATEALLLAREC